MSCKDHPKVALQTAAMRECARKLRTMLEHAERHLEGCRDTSLSAEEKVEHGWQYLMIVNRAPMMLMAAAHFTEGDLTLGIPMLDLVVQYVEKMASNCCAHTLKDFNEYTVAIMHQANQGEYARQCNEAREAVADPDTAMFKRTQTESEPEGGWN